MTLADGGFLDIGPNLLEYKMIGSQLEKGCVLLHEGLGSVGLGAIFQCTLRMPPASACPGDGPGGVSDRS